MRPSRILLAACALVLAACGGDDGDSGQPDAATGIDAPAAVCTGAAYEPCADTTGWTDCLDGMECRFFMSQGFTICTPTCDASNPCPPDEHGSPVACNMMGRCRADAPTSCTPP